MMLNKFCHVLLLCCMCNMCYAQEKIDTLIVGYTMAPPFIMENNSGLEGVNIWLWEHVAKDLDIEYQLEFMEFTTMLNALENGSIDVCINPLTITSDRHKLMGFTDSFYASNSTIAVAKNSTLEKFVAFVKGFFNANFIKGLLVLAFIILLFGLLGWYFERRKNPEHFRSGISGVWDGLWWSAVTLTTVGYGDKAPQSKGGKVTALILMFGGLLFISGLTASIASSLTMNQMASNPDSFDEFKERTVGSVEKSSAHAFLKERFFKDVQAYESAVLGLEALKNKDIDAFIYDEPILKYCLRKDQVLEDIELLPLKFDVQLYAFAIAKKHPELEQKISQKILEITESQEWELVLNEFGLTEF